MTNLMKDYDPYSRMDAGPPGSKDPNKLDNLLKLLEKMIKMIIDKIKAGVK